MTNSEPTIPRGRGSLFPFDEKGTSEFLPVLDPEIRMLNSTEFLLVKGTTSILVLGSTHLTKNTSVSVLLIMEF